MTTTRLLSRAVLRLSPNSPDEDVVGFLQGLVTSDVATVLPVWAGLLTPQGKALFDFIVWPDEAPGQGGLLIDCEADAADALVRRLSLYRLRRAITIARDDGLEVHWAPGAQGDGAPDPRLGVLGRRWLEARSGDGDSIGADDAWLAHRLAHGVAEGRAELGDGATLWLECNAADLSGVSFTKGCYVGQENTARMNWRQKVSRRLVVVPLARSDPARRRAAYPDLDLAVDHLRVEDIHADVTPAWLAIGATGAGTAGAPAA